MICDFPEWSEFLTYCGFKSDENITKILVFLGEKIKVGKEEAGTIAFNEEYYKFQAK